MHLCSKSWAYWVPTTLGLFLEDGGCQGVISTFIVIKI